VKEAAMSLDARRSVIVVLSLFFLTAAPSAGYGQATKQRRPK
jgi:hypothetical protein